MRKIRIAINGFGRIGRTFFRVAFERPELDIVAVNDLTDPENLAYLLKYDTTYGTSNLDIHVKKDGERTVFSVNNKVILFLNQKEPRQLPWKQLEVDIVVESTGVFAGFEKSKVHLEAGAKRVVVSAPVKDEPIGINGSTVLMGVNDHLLETCDISSNASCTTNAGSPLISILDESIGIEKATLTTVHGYTTTQALVDGPNKKDFRRGRAAAQNIVPSTTGAATAIAKANPELAGRFDGIAIRVPVLTGSLVDVTFITEKDTSVEEVNEALKKAAGSERWKKVFSVTEEPLVSSDIVGSPYASIADLAMTKVIDGNLVKVLAWYDNEMGYVYSLVEHVVRSGQYVVS